MIFENLKADLDFKKFSDVLIALEYFRETPLMCINEEQSQYLIDLREAITEHMLGSDNPITHDIKEALKGIRSVNTIANLFVVTANGNLPDTTDHVLTKVLKLKNNYVKILMLYSARNVRRLPLRELFEGDNRLASYWWGNVLTAKMNILENTNQHSKEILHNVPKDLYTAVDHQWCFDNQEVVHPYFDVTYIDDKWNMPIRNMINAEMKRITLGFKIDLENRDEKCIAVITGGMEPGHVVHRSIMPFLKQLKGHYKLILFNHSNTFEDSFFDVAYHLKGKGMDFIIEKVKEHNCGITLYPEIGLSQTSIMLSNLRLCPVQITMHGHPVTTGNSEIDYFIGGEYDEQKDFSEELIRMPCGLALTPVLGGMVPVPTKHDDETRIIIGLNWGNVKFNHDLFIKLQDVINISPANKIIELRFFSVLPKDLRFLATWHDIKSLFGHNEGIDIKISALMPLSHYLIALEQCDFLIDSYPFGSHNRIVDMLLVGRPILTLKRGNKAYNNFSSWILDKVGLKDFNWKHWPTKEELDEKSKQMWANDLTQELFSFDKQTFFKEIIDGLATKVTTKETINAA